MAEVTTLLQDSTGTHWAVYGRYTATGGEPGITIPSSKLTSVAPYGTTIIVDGIGIWYFRAGGGGQYLYPKVYAAWSKQDHYLTEFLTTGIQSTVHRAPLNLHTKLEPGTSLISIGTNAMVALDVIDVTAWGHYLPSPSTEPETVRVEGVRIFPKKIPTGAL